MNNNTIALNKIDYQKLFLELPGLYIILSTDLIILDASEKLTMASGISRREMIGKNLFDVFPENPDDLTADGQPNLKYSLNYVLKNKTAHTMAVQRYDVRNADGIFEERYWSPINKPVLNKNGEVEFIIHRVEEVTDFIQLTLESEKALQQNSELESQIKHMKIEIIKRSKDLEKLNAALDEKVVQRTKHLEEANKIIEKNIITLTNQKKQLEDFCNIISHNLRAPLVNISMLVEMVAENSVNNRNNILLEKLDKAAKNLNETFNELVESIQISQDTEIPFEEIELHHFAESIIDGLQGEINKTNAIIDMNFNAAPRLYYPVNYMRSILHNLISNALKYSSPYRRPIIKITSESTKEFTVISISDNGLGIDLKKHSENLFKIRKVFHSHPAAKGFGLFITKSQVTALGGKIWVESEPDVGSTFFVEFINQPNEITQ
ncbi:PAS domain-containing sensor histidine kinase [Flavobacterium sp.]|uniref:PAS domain-containing sensor histidine kinase n=1 Tax=Flavobacterium sp. TaxID=239 RepID=UPI0026007490|nr:PAS domain-containing sensor histidine kinase [Flavobacterium sp.]